jgi:hypothetical protein
VAFVAGGMSKVLALVTTYPFTLVRTRLQVMVLQQIALTSTRMTEEKQRQSKHTKDLCGQCVECTGLQK